MREVEPTWGRIGRVWWLLMWRGSLGGAILGAIAGGLAGFVVGVFMAIEAEGHPDAAALHRAGQIAGLAVSAPVTIIWGFAIVGMALRKRYRGFRIALVSEEAGEAEIMDDRVSRGL